MSGTGNKGGGLSWALVIIFLLTVAGFAALVLSQ